jgi:uncharacterized protein (TIGR02646 family)
MRKLYRPTEPPEFLISPRVAREKARLFDYLRRDANDRRQRRDDLNEELFYDASLQTALDRVFFGKCAFCESEIYSQGRLVHFRPLRFVEGEPPADNDYYLWLAFEWRNLFRACDACHRAKGSIFPVRGDRADYLATFDDVVDQEVPLILDPTNDDPGRHLRFLHDGACHPLTVEGATTIQTFALNREDLVVELKMTTYFEGAGFPIAKRLVHSIKGSHYLKTSPIIIQSFEISPLQGLFKELSGYANIQFQVLVGSLSDRPADFRTSLLDRSWAELLAPGQIARVKEFTNWLGMSYSALAPLNADGPLGGSRNLITAAHDESLLVSAWTFRPENKFLAQDLRSSGIPMERNASGSISEMRRYLALGLDGIITDDPGLGRKAVDGQK